MGVNARLFQQAAEAVDPNDVGSIATMMRLACEGLNPTRRRWAALWLRRNCNVIVIPEGTNDAAQEASESLRR